MAGAGYKLFVSGDVLTAAQVNNYLQQQVTMVFANSTARTTALSGVLAEGMMSYLQDTNAVEVYNGSSWVNVGNSGDITGVTAGTGLTGGGTSGAVTLTNDMATTITTNGDLIYGTGSGTYTRRGIGSSGQVLTVSGGVPAWTTLATGGMTLISTTTFNNTVSTYTFSSLGSYKHLLFLGTDMQHNSSAANSRINMRFNSDSGSNYGYSLMQMNGTTYSGTVGNNQEAQIIISVPNGSVVGAQGNANAKLRGGELSLFIANYGSSSQVKQAFWQGGSCQDGTRCQTEGVGRWYNTSAITSVTINFDNAAVNWHTGTLLLYGMD